MSQDATVNAGDIARLVDVGRAAVSNWRRRHDDFPQPVGGTASSPLFSLREIEEWLRDNGKTYEVSLADRTWQRLRAVADDLRLGDTVASAGALLLDLRAAGPARRLPGPGTPTSGPSLGQAPPAGVVSATVPPGSPRGDSPGGQRSLIAGERQADVAWSVAAGVDPAGLLPVVPEPLTDPVLVSLLGELADELGHAAAFEFLCARYQEAHSRRLALTPADVADLILELVGPVETLFDPACGLGTLLLGAPAGTVVAGQELRADGAVIAVVRLLLADVHATTRAGDSLRKDGFAGQLADAVVCDPPFNERAWGYAELISDPRWEYGLPPRGESELAWVQHCLAHVRPGGLVAILMPPAAAARRPGKRIRGNLLRAGALRAVVSLAANGPDLWLLRRPEPGDRPPSSLLLMPSPDGLADAWRRHLRGDHGDAVRIIDLLDDDVDLSPARHQPAMDEQRLVRDLHAAAETLRALGLRPPEFDVPVRQQALPTTTVGELVRAGLLTVTHAQARLATGTGDVPVLTADDLADGTTPSGRTTDEAGLVRVAENDVVASVFGAVRVLTTGDAVLGPYLTRYRADPARLDPDFLAGLLRAGAPVAHAGSSRTDVRRIQVPRLPIAQQRRYGAAFRQLVALEDALRTAASAGGTLVRLGFDGLAAGHLRPAE
jgi:hypothetical protein